MVKISKLFFSVFLSLFLIGLVYAGTHYASQVIPGSFANGNYSFNGSVGIGTNNPARMLTINGGNSNSRILLQTNNSGTMISDGFELVSFTDGNAYVWNYEEAGIHFGVNNTEKLSISNNGNVGIGTTNPSRTLTITAGNPILFLNGTSYSAIQMYDGSAPVDGKYSFISTRSGWFSIDQLNDAGQSLNTRFYLNLTSGNVGIGTTNPFTTLHVKSGTSGNSPFVLETLDTSDVSSILPTNGMTYLSSGLYYKNSAWVHDSFNTNNAILGIGGGSGGVWYASNNGAPSWNVASAITLWSAAGVLVGASSRDLKENFTELNKEEILDDINKLNITRWNYKTEKNVTHIGPIAEEFKEIFNTGDSNQSIALIDEAGIALAGVQGLIIKVEALEQKNLEQQQEIEKLKRRIEILENK